MTISEQIAGILAGLEHVKTWGTNAERGCIELVESWKDSTGAVVHSVTHNYLDDWQAAQPGPSTEVAVPDTSIPPAPIPDAAAMEAAATAARVAELTAAGHPDPVAGASTPAPSSVDDNGAHIPGAA